MKNKVKINERWIYRGNLILQILEKGKCCGSEYRCQVKYVTKQSMYSVNDIDMFHFYPTGESDKLLHNQNAEIE